MKDTDFALTAFLDTHQIVFQLDLNTGEMIIYKSNRMPVDTSKTYHFKDVITKYLQTFSIAQEDIPKFTYYMNLKNLLSNTLSSQSSVLFSYRMHLENRTVWCRVIVSAPDSFYTTSEKKILVYQRELPDSEANLEISMNSWSKRFYKISKINIKTNEYVVIKERKHETIMRNEYKGNSPYLDGWLVDRGLIYKDDVEMYLHYLNPEVLSRYFSSGEEEFFFYYRRKIGNMFKWVQITIVKSIEYTEDEQVFIYYAEDVQDMLANILDKQGLTQYIESVDDKNLPQTTDSYNRNLLSVLSYFTEQYLDFFMIDLINNLYILYKINPAVIHNSIPYIGNYQEMALRLLENRSEHQDNRLLTLLSKPETLIQLLNEKASIQIIQKTRRNQIVKTQITKIASQNGIPSKAICFTLPYTTDKQLKVTTFGNFQVFDENGSPIKFTKKQSKQLLAYLIDKQGYPSSTKDIVTDILEKDSGDLNAVKYVSTLTRNLIKDLEAYGYVDIIDKEYNTLKINTSRIDCDYYHLLNGDFTYWSSYHNEYMKEYSWAESTNAEILNMYDS